ncbi:receptor-binding cancer antigen expressed on SiSo cells [Procambarus clarkii]|uniref:receptor-binding cancer antigen expressed on SiSo cells n=1 Tax=Procambarus clarkii TaxID=6728 RepID=UPI001E676472|nr:receptor-binding cancer antigen expressed on SiSo cells-like [Procambarus clarkii]
MIVMVAVRKVKSLLLLLLGLVRRCFCCFRRRRHSETHLPIAISVEDSTHAVPPTQNDDGLGCWDSWDVPSSVVSDGGGRASLSPQQSMMQQQINQYRLNQQRKLQESESEPEPEPNYFEDLAPSIEKKPQVVILERPEEEQQVSNRLPFSLADPLLQSSELEEWMEDDGGWEDEAEEEADLDAVLREKRQLERDRRRQEQQRRKAEKEAARSSKLSASKIATKLS